ncbi:CoA transferase [Azorhizobium oxalatiphilum]|uniref:CoA transferase n=1 Tax=Azorhizobium oxalatiphilum TaxID=980631 RepID=A0A917C4T6_9HYPH|nr:CaiB/BaiF CoA-transferase family protein [Azorhizobium oxalatiphilum]GGF69016.1 CoA transferase [Azorhizobium oxalatiphilum]
MPKPAPHVSPRPGPLAGLRVVEFVGIGPAPFCTMLLSDLGAEVISIDRTVASGLGIARPPRFDILARGRPVLRLDLKRPEGLALARELVGRADALVEGFRPGAMERLGLGPEDLLGQHPALVYGRVTGWGQEGPLAQSAGHDLNYIALTGALHAIGRAGQPPTPPLNLVGDFGGGGLLLAFGIVCALHSARATGRGQVVDAAMIDGAATLMASMFGLAAAGLHGTERGTNLLDSGAPHYDVYACADGQYVAVAPIEQKFRAQMLARLGIAPEDERLFADPASWPQARALLAERFRAQPRAHWESLFADTDACVAPVLTMAEAPAHAHHRARGSFVEVDGVAHPAPAPRFSGTPAAAPGADVRTAAERLAGWGLDEARLDALAAAGVVHRDAGEIDKNRQGG